MLQQPVLIETPAPIPCAYCASVRHTVLRDREIAGERRYLGAETTICCTPDSDYHCPRCHSGKLDFAMRYASAEGEDSGEVYQCNACGATGDVEDAAPPVEPWAELEAVAEQPELLPRIAPAAAPDFTKREVA